MKNVKTLKPIKMLLTYLRILKASLTVGVYGNLMIGNLSSASTVHTS